MKERQKYTCTVTYTEGYERRITEAFVELYYERLEGIVPMKSQEKVQEASA